MKEMKGRKRREREWKSQPGKWRRSRRAPSGKFGSGIREFYHGVQWPTQVSAHVGSNCLPLLAERKRAGVDVIFFFFSLRVIKRPLVQVSILSTANARRYEWAIKLPHHGDFPQDLLFDIVGYLLKKYRTAQLLARGLCQQWCHRSLGTRPGVHGARCCLVQEIELHFCYHYPNVHDGYKKF